MRRGLTTSSLMVLLLAAGCSSRILGGLDETSANESLGALEHAGISAEKIADETSAGAAATGYALRVARGDASRALDVLRARGLPRERRHGYAEVYSQASLLPTASEERARFIDATAGELERTLETADGIVSARVHLVLEEPDPLAIDAKPRTPARAAVLMKAAEGHAPLSEVDVQRLVAGSVPGLEPSAVAVVVTAAPTSAATEAGVGPLASLGPLRVTPSSRPLLVTVLGTGLATICILAALLLLSLRRAAGRAPKV